MSAGVDGIVAAIHNEADPKLHQGKSSRQAALHIPWEIILFLGFIVVSWLGSILARSKSWWAGGGFFGGDDSNSGSGFGGFGGGGASGDW